MTAFLADSAPIAFAHRGYSPAGAENSMAAFDAAVRLGYRYLETDARVTADGVALAFHDDRLDRVTDGRGRLAELAWTEVGRALIGGTEPIPRLDDLLAAWPDVRVNIDIKSGRALDATLAAVRRTGAEDRVCLAAFSDARMRRIRHAVGPDVCTSLGPAEVARLITASRAPQAFGLPAARRLRGQCAQLPPTLSRLTVVSPRLLDTAHAAGLVVHVWTINSAAEMRALLDLGVDGIMTDEAEILRDLLRDRGAWPSGPPKPSGPSS